MTFLKTQNSKNTNPSGQCDVFFENINVFSWEKIRIGVLKCFQKDADIYCCKYISDMCNRRQLKFFNPNNQLRCNTERCFNHRNRDVCYDHDLRKHNSKYQLIENQELHHQLLLKTNGLLFLELTTFRFFYPLRSHPCTAICMNLIQQIYAYPGYVSVHRVLWTKSWIFFSNGFRCFFS